MIVEKVDTIYLFTKNGYEEFISVDSAVKYVFTMFGKEISNRAMQNWVKESPDIRAYKVDRGYFVEYGSLFNFCRNVKEFDVVG